MSVLSITFAKISAKAARFYNFDKIAPQNPLSSALPTLPLGGDAPFSSGCACHLSRFIGKVYPEGGSELLSLRGSGATKQSPGRVWGYGVYVPHFFRGADRGSYVILSVSEISHDQSEKYKPCGNSPSREIASLRSQRQILLPPSGEVSRSADRG